MLLATFNAYICWNLFTEVEGAWQNILKTCGILAVLINTLILLTPVEEVFKAVRLIFPSLGPNKNVGERSYGQDCSFYTPDHPTSNFANFLGALDIFVIAHVAGLFSKMVIIRDLKMLMCISLFWELLEIMTKHILPNFEECWWDQLLLDFLGCNMLGIVLGWLWLKYMRWERFDIVGTLWVEVGEHDPLVHPQWHESEPNFLHSRRR